VKENGPAAEATANGTNKKKAYQLSTKNSTNALFRAISRTAPGSRGAVQ
jgi:hypothetical protein